MTVTIRVLPPGVEPVYPGRIWKASIGRLWWLFQWNRTAVRVGITGGRKSTKPLSDILGAHRRRQKRIGRFMVGLTTFDGSDGWVFDALLFHPR